jgi:hypothetical protein
MEQFVFHSLQILRSQDRDENELAMFLYFIPSPIEDPEAYQRKAPKPLGDANTCWRLKMSDVLIKHSIGRILLT